MKASMKLMAFMAAALLSLTADGKKQQQDSSVVYVARKVWRWAIFHELRTQRLYFRTDFQEIVRHAI